MRRVLIANRGEIAVRIAQACRDAGLVSIAVYADSDRNALHVRLADEAYALRGDTAADSYLDIRRILDAAAAAGADAVHPGYGFLAESAELARAVRGAGLVWIGPRAETIELLGDKVAARRIAREVGVPVVPGTDEPVATSEEIASFTRSNGFPVAIKAAYGGGGRGLRVARTDQEVPELLESAVREAVGAFGRGECFVERYLDSPRHVETQCLADERGEIAVLSTRDCSVQRRHQKLVEEAPAAGLSRRQQELLRSGSAAILRKAGYVGAATCEFLLGPDGSLFFLEVNTRLQVEHTVTEQVTGIDLVREMLRIADGQRLGYSDALVRGHALEFRINAEDPRHGFVPASGRLNTLALPTGPGVRVDTGYAEGDTVPSQFDSLIAKLVITGTDREQALVRSRRALAALTVEGVPTLVPFHRALVKTPEFTAPVPRVHTRWVETDFSTESLAPGVRSATGVEPAEPRERIMVEVDGRRYEVGLPSEALRRAAVVRPRRATGATTARRSRARGTGTAVTAPTPATVVKVAVADGDLVETGDTVAVLEAMKMEQPLTAHRAGVVRALDIEAGRSVERGDVLCEIVDALEGRT